MRIKRVTVGVVLLLCAAPVVAAPPAGNKAACNKSLVATMVADLNFGNFLASGAGTVTIAPDGTRTATGAITLYSGATSPAIFDLVSTDTGNCQTLPVQITLPNSVTLSDAAGNSMTASTWVSVPADNTTTLDASDYMQVSVGATLTVNAGQVGGTYTTSSPFSVTLKF